MKSQEQVREQQQTSEAVEAFELWRQVLRIRLVEERIAAEYGKQEMRCPTHLSIGQEAAAVGVASVLKKEDAAFSGHRAHAHYLAKGGNLQAMIAEIYGKEAGCAKGRGGSQHLIDLEAGFWGSTPIVGGTIPLAVGAAWAFRLREESRMAVTFFGEGATEEGVWHESVNFAVLHKLPVLFACENNLYSVYTPLRERQPERAVADLATAHGLFVQTGDGNNVQEVMELAGRAREHIMAGRGPAFLELATYRWREHCGPNWDDELGYRPAGELIEWQGRDPLMLARQAALGLEVDEKEMIAAQVDIEAEIEDAFSIARASEWPLSIEEGNVYG